MMLAQLIYVSTRKSTCTELEIKKILESCQKNNPSQDITGVLVYNDKRFMQLVEGEYKTIMGFYERIKGDTRHEGCVMISCTPIKNRSFPNWSMGCKKIDNSIEVVSTISKTDETLLQKIFAGATEPDGNKSLQMIQKLFQ